MKQKLLLTFFSMAILVMVMLSSCKHRNRGMHDSGKWTPEDSTVVESMVKKMTVPVFTCAEDVIKYQKEYKDSEEEKVIFLSMTPQMIDRVTRVAISRSKNDYITLHELIEEYINGADIYNRLIERGEPDPMPIPAPPSTCPDTINIP